MDSAPFFDAFQELNQRFLRLLDDLSALRSLSAIALTQQSEQGLLESALGVLTAHAELARCSVFLLDGRILRCAAGAELSLDTAPDAERHPLQFRLGEGIMGLAAETGRLQHCRDTRLEPGFLRAPAGHGPIGSLVCVPVLSGDEVLGVVNVSHPEPAYFDAGHERLLQVFASFLGQMLANWRYYHAMEAQIRRRTVHLEAALKEAESLKRRYQELAVVDELTGIHNRRFFFPEAAAALANALRAERGFALLMVDLDHFKQINDTHGHATGDRVLQITAALLKGQTREGDIVARFGGEEFVLALPGTDGRGAHEVAERILTSLGGVEYGRDAPGLRVSATIGITHVGLVPPELRHPDLLEQLVRRADQALYLGKSDGRGRIRHYEETVCIPDDGELRPVDPDSERPPTR